MLQPVNCHPELGTNESGIFLSREYCSDFPSVSVEVPALTVPELNVNVTSAFASDSLPASYVNV